MSAHIRSSISVFVAIPSNRWYPIRFGVTIRHGLGLPSVAVSVAIPSISWYVAWSICFCFCCYSQQQMISGMVWGYYLLLFLFCCGNRETAAPTKVHSMLSDVVRICCGDWIGQQQMTLGAYIQVRRLITIFLIIIFIGYGAVSSQGRSQKIHEINVQKSLTNNVI